jgi:hypothetical protein
MRRSSSGSGGLSGPLNGTRCAAGFELLSARARGDERHTTLVVARAAWCGLAVFPARRDGGRRRGKAASEKHGVEHHRGEVFS